MRALRVVPAFLLVGLLACESPTVVDAPADLSPWFAAVTYNLSQRYPVDINVYVPCAADGAGEYVQLSGFMQELYAYAINDNRLTLTTQSNPQNVVGEGLTTGDMYRGTGITRDTYSGSFVNGQATETLINNFLMIGAGPGNNYRVHQTFHVTLTADGELTAYVDNFRVECG